MHRMTCQARAVCGSSPLSGCRRSLYIPELAAHLLSSWVPALSSRVTQQRSLLPRALRKASCRAGAQVVHHLLGSCRKRDPTCDSLKCTPPLWVVPLCVAMIWTKPQTNRAGVGLQDTEEEETTNWAEELTLPLSLGVFQPVTRV